MFFPLANRPGSATSVQIRSEITELEASLADVVEEAEWHLQQETETKQDHLVDETNFIHTPMEVDNSRPPIQANKSVSQPKELLPDQMVSESGTVRGIKGRVKEQIASNQSKIMLEGLMMKKQQPFARPPLSVIHRAENVDASQTETSLKRYCSQEAISNKESEDVMKRSNSLKNNQSGAQTDGKQKHHGKAPPPPQDKVRTKQFTAISEGQNATILPGSNRTLQQNTEALVKQTAPPATTPDTEKKVPPKIKPKTARTKSKEAEDNSMVVPEASPKAFHSRSSPHPHLSKRARSEPHIKRIPQGSPRIDRKSTAVIESSEDGQKVLVLSPGGGKTNKDTQVRIFLPPPPPVLPPCPEQEAMSDTEPKDTNNITSVNNTNIESTVVTDKTTGEVTRTVANQLRSDTINSGPSSRREQNNKTTKSLPLQQQNKGGVTHLSGNDDLEVDSEMEAIEPLPQVLFHSLQDLPATPPGTPCNELETAEMKMAESELNDDDDDLDIVPPPPPLDDLNIDIADALPPPDDFDPLSLPPPLPINDDDAFDIILPPPSSTEDDIIATTATPPTLSTADDAITVPPPSSSFLEDDIIADTTEISSQPDEDDKTFQDLPFTMALPEVNDEALVAVQGGYDNDDEIMLNLLPDDVSVSESDTELPAAVNENIVSALESTEPDTITDAAETDEDEKSICQPDIQAEIITGELENITSDVPADVEQEKPEVTAEIQQSQDDLSSIIASLETMLQDEPQSNTEQMVDDINATSLDWVQLYGGHIPIEAPTEAPVDSRKVDKPKADLDQQLSDDFNQTVTTMPTLDIGSTGVKPKPTASIPVRAAPPPPPLPPIGKVKTPPEVTSPTKAIASPTKAKSPPPAVKPKPKRPVSGTLTEEFQDELAEKLKRRQQKIHDWAKDDDKPKSPTQTCPTIFPTVPSGTVQNRTAAYNTTTPVKPNLQATSMQGAAVPTAQLTTTVGTQEQMEQLQSLQNQLLQQQILQLQQQLQQLQGQVAAGNPMMAMPQIMPQAGTDMQFPQVGTGIQFPQAANLMQAPQLSTGMQIPMQQQNEIAMDNPMQTAQDGRKFNAAGMPKLTTSADSESKRSESPPPLPPSSPPPLDNSPNYDQVIRRGMNKNTSDSARQQRPSSQVLRSRVFGEYEDVLDDILEEVREVDHDTLLRKVSTT